MQPVSSTVLGSCPAQGSTGIGFDILGIEMFEMLSLCLHVSRHRSSSGPDCLG